MQEEFIKQLVDLEQLKAAVFCMKTLGLDDAFPGLDRQYRAEAVSELCARGRWAVAARFVGEDVDLQEQVSARLLLCMC